MIELFTLKYILNILRIKLSKIIILMAIMDKDGQKKKLWNIMFKRILGTMTMFMRKKIRVKVVEV